MLCLLYLGINIFSANANVNSILDNLLNAAKEAKESVNNEVLQLQGEQPATSMDAPTGDNMDAGDDDSLELDEPAPSSDIASDGDDSASGPLDEPLGRAKKV